MGLNAVVTKLLEDSAHVNAQGGTIGVRLERHQGEAMKTLRRF